VDFETLDAWLFQPGHSSNPYVVDYLQAVYLDALGIVKSTQNPLSKQRDHRGINLFNGKNGDPGSYFVLYSGPSPFIGWRTRLHQYWQV
jgi:hypothetical protein